MSRVYVSIGSNIDQEKNIISCLNSMRKHFGKLSVSTVYENKAIGFEGDNFYNLAVGFDSDDNVYEIANTLRAIENEHGRNRGSVRFSSRTLDIDLLLVDDLILHEKDFDIPRHEITKYAFVLKPLAEICPDCQHPELNKSIEELWREFDGDNEKMWPITLGDSPDHG